jgi:hypothetical protein
MRQHCNGINEKEISQVVGITAMENPNQSVMVNGQVVIGKSFVLHCPLCGRVVYSFDNPGITLPQVIQACHDNNAKLLDIATYCSKCGQRLNYNVGLIEGEYTELKEKKPLEPGETKPIEEQVNAEESPTEKNTSTDQESSEQTPTT